MGGCLWWRRRATGVNGTKAPHPAGDGEGGEPLDQPLQEVGLHHLTDGRKRPGDFEKEREDQVSPLLQHSARRIVCPYAGAWLHRVSTGGAGEHLGESEVVAISDSERPEEAGKDSEVSSGGENQMRTSAPGLQDGGGDPARGPEDHCRQGGCHQRRLPAVDGGQGRYHQPQ